MALCQTSVVSVRLDPRDPVIVSAAVAPLHSTYGRHPTKEFLHFLQLHLLPPPTRESESFPSGHGSYYKTIVTTAEIRDTKTANLSGVDVCACECVSVWMSLC